MLKWKPRFCGCRLKSLEDLQPFVGHFLKYTKDGGRTWRCVFVEELLYSPENPEVISGIKCCLRTMSKQGRTVTAKVLFTEEFFKGDSEKIWFSKVSPSEYEDLYFPGSSFVLPPYIEPYIIEPCVAVRAPLTLVRSEKPTELEISVAYDQRRFAPQEPIEPAPSEIRTEGPVLKYTWKVLSDADGTLTHQQQKINMIWWEARRKSAFASLDPSQAVCVPRAELKAFLSEVLKKNGLKDSEIEAFACYWEGLFNEAYWPEKTPCVLVQPVLAERLPEYVPDLEVVRTDGEPAFDAKRFYFLFEPTASQERGMSAGAYLSRMENRSLGPNVVLDLGGEIAASQDVDTAQPWTGMDAFNQAFMKQYIYGKASKRPSI